MHLNCETARKVRIPRVNKQKPQVILIFRNGVNAHVELAREILGSLCQQSCCFASVSDTFKAFKQYLSRKELNPILLKLHLHLDGSGKTCASRGISHLEQDIHLYPQSVTSIWSLWIALYHLTQACLPFLQVLILTGKPVISMTKIPYISMTDFNDQKFHSLLYHRFVLD